MAKKMHKIVMGNLEIRTLSFSSNASHVEVQKNLRTSQVLLHLTV